MSTVLLRLVVGTTVEPTFKRRRKPSQKVPESSDVSGKSIQVEGERVISQSGEECTEGTGEVNNTEMSNQ